MSITLPQYLNNNTPAVAIQFDDGRASLYTKAFAYMQSKGMKGTAYIISTLIGGSYVTEAQILEMDAAGWDMANHTTTATHLDTLTLEEQTTAISDCKTYLDGIGATRASSHVTYPNGNYNANTLTAMSNLGMLTGKTTGEEQQEKMRYMVANPYVIPVQPIRIDAYTAAQAIGWIGRCLCMGTVAAVVWHDILDSGAATNEYNYSDFQTVIDWIYSQKLPTLTVTQLYSLFSGSLEYTPYW